MAAIRPCDEPRVHTNDGLVSPPLPHSLLLSTTIYKLQTNYKSPLLLS